MNYLAHLYLSPDDDLSRLGNVMGDFVRDVDMGSLPKLVQEGIRMHQSIDVFTDTHPIVRNLRINFSKERRRFSGIALDVVFDHFLIQNWEDLTTNNDLDKYVDDCHASLLRQRDLMPERMEMVVSWMINRNWIRSYAQLNGVGRALDGLAGRLRAKHNFFGVIDEIEAHYDEIQTGFLEFFPQLQAHVDDFGS